MTRARTSLVLSHASSRAIFGMLHPRAPSPFLAAIPHSLAPRRTERPAGGRALPSRRPGGAWGRASWGGAAVSGARPTPPGGRAAPPSSGSREAVASWGAGDDDLPF
eukprot:scaffold14114_cov90-Isochrysis_galbana.AAC.1